MKFVCGSCRTKYQISDEKIRGKILTIRCKKCSSKILVRESLAREAGGTVVAPVADDDKAEVGSVAVTSDSPAPAPSKAPSSSPAAAASPRTSASLQSAFDVAMRAAGEPEADDMPTTIAPTPANLDKAGVEWYVAIDGEQSGPFAFAELVRKVQAKEVAGRHYVWHDGMDGWHRVRDLADLAAYLGAEKKKPPPPPGAPEGVAVAPLEGPTEAKVEPKAPGGREEQLDHVLNEALGIQGEGATQKMSSVT